MKNKHLKSEAGSLSDETESNPSPDLYLDPETGLWVFTRAALLKRGYCCETGCRHCPYRESSENES